MTDIHILIVEDESIVAESLQDRLEKLGYNVAGLAASGEDAIQLVKTKSPDLVLMDIMLAGKMDGIEAAETIRERFEIPVVYLTSYSDSGTLKRAKITQPFGYLIKPFKERELHTTIEIALHKHQLETKLKENEQWLTTILRSIGDAVITTNKQGILTYVSPVAEKLIGKPQTEIIGQPIRDALAIQAPDNSSALNKLITKVLKGETSHCLMPPDAVMHVSEDQKIPVDVGLSPIQDDRNRITGVVLAIRDITERKKAEEALNEAQQILSNLLTPRERELLQMMVDGLSTKEIAFDLKISPRTVETHKNNMMHKLNIHDTPMLIRSAIVQKLVKVRE